MKRRLILILVLVAILTTPVLAQPDRGGGGYYTRPNLRWVALGSGIAAGVVISGFSISEGTWMPDNFLDTLSPGHRAAVKITGYVATSIVGMATSMIGTTAYFQIVNQLDVGWRYVTNGAIYGFTAAAAAHGLTLATAGFVTQTVSGVPIGSAWDSAGEAFLWGPWVGLAGAFVGTISGLVLYFTNPDRAGFF